jgi:hypothetical protein
LLRCGTRCTGSCRERRTSGIRVGTTVSGPRPCDYHWIQLRLSDQSKPDGSRIGPRRRSDSPTRDGLSADSRQRSHPQGWSDPRTGPRRKNGSPKKRDGLSADSRQRSHPQRWSDPSIGPRRRNGLPKRDVPSSRLHPMGETGSSSGWKLWSDRWRGSRRVSDSSRPNEPAWWSAHSNRNELRACSERRYCVSSSSGFWRYSVPLQSSDQLTSNAR